MALYRSFHQVATAWKKKHSVEMAQQEMLDRTSRHLQTAVKQKHGRAFPRESRFTRARKGGSSPLRDTGLLQASVYRLINGPRQAVVWQGNEWLGKIHEYGLVMKMTEKQKRWLFAQMDKLNMPKSGSGGDGYIRIPPRPIWRSALQENRLQIYRIAHIVLKKHLTN